VQQEAPLVTVFLSAYSRLSPHKLVVDTIRRATSGHLYLHYCAHKTRTTNNKMRSGYFELFHNQLLRSAHLNYGLMDREKTKDGSDRNSMFRQKIHELRIVHKCSLALESSSDRTLRHKVSYSHHCYIPPRAPVLHTLASCTEITSHICASALLACPQRSVLTSTLASRPDARLHSSSRQDS